MFTLRGWCRRTSSPRPSWSLTTRDPHWDNSWASGRFAWPTARRCGTEMPPGTGTCTAILIGRGCSPTPNIQCSTNVYSLGVCLLEIGLWRSLVAYDPENGSPSLAKTTAGFPDIGNPNLKDVLITLATDVLRQRIENKFAQVVVNCLTCMDESNRDFEDKEDFQDEDGVLIGVKYIEKVGVTVLEAESGLANLT
ncbi:hypothetical protein IFM58399_03334 [Aspergillus lentulus]|uniref:uncharacterized protein n=1 Tax=Aspergillus lentulus TaxID=293939 RepID=UPI001394C9FB|nr:uncharacterized protein IFM58399_03334 [Aspergillus lentulus]GFF32839.1 hypothetical protein IFM58399_03334 [Aspergillus lentulus]GFF76794.1 hypothetical protein IFM62136_09407 [Aspergillus lentulus]GFG06015.1 hypothetical protein IFM61392_04130 [Aspergillus lentulus]